MGKTRSRVVSSRTSDPRNSGRQRAVTPRKVYSSDVRSLSHVDADGRVRMVDVGTKRVTAREAVARGRVTIAPAALKLIREGRVAKGDPLQAARLAGIMAAKRTAELIPLCHPLALTHVDLQIRPARLGVEIEARVRTEARTGVEMEALTAVAVAGLTIYDMVKSADRAMELGSIRLVEKRGGRSGHYVSSDA